MEPIVDAVVVGAGFGGIYQLYKFHQLGLSVRLIDNGSEIGGTWFWNKYPGATSDSSSETRYLEQPEIQGYLKHVVEHNNLGQYIQLNTEMLSAEFEDNLWNIRLDNGDTIRSRYLATALGALSEANLPDIAGIETFKGHLYHSARWPKNQEYKNKRVGVVGNGSSGVQIMTSIADDVEKLVLFQRHAQYVVPSGQGPLPQGYRENIMQNYDDVWKYIRSSVYGHNVEESKVSAIAVTDKEREKLFEKAWQDGNALNFLFGVFGDIATNAQSNEEAAKFIRKKISQIVTDPKKARKLTPTGMWSRRPVNGPNYYQIFNNDHVDVVDIQATPIEILPNGVRTSDGTFHELDIIVLATGFDAFEGNYKKVLIKGRNGETLQKHWTDGPSSFLSVSVSGFPNLFLVQGPQGPYGNAPPIIESEVDFIGNLVAYAEEQKKRQLGESGKSANLNTIETGKQNENDWTALSRQLAEKSLMAKGTEGSWLFGTNIAGAKIKPLFFLGGLGEFRRRMQEEVENGFPGFIFSV